LRDGALRGGESIQSVAFCHGTALARKVRRPGSGPAETSGSSSRGLLAGPTGVSGQVIEFEPDGWYSAFRQYDSVLAILRRTVESLRAGGSVPDHYNAEITDQPGHQASLYGVGESIAELPGATVQQLTIDGPDSFDASELASLPLLIRELRNWQARHTQS
jgi:hypothetical protein